VTAPRVIYAPEPEFSEEARKAKFQGTVVLWLIVGREGRTHEVRVYRSLGMGLDEKAIEAIRQWRFEPGRKDGIPVAVQVNVEVSFVLY
jgi:TonB family protein